MSKEVPPASKRKATTTDKTKTSAAPAAAMGTRLPRGTGLATAFMGCTSSSAPAPNSSNSPAVLFPAAGRVSGSSGWGFPTSGGSSHGGGSFTNASSTSGFRIAPSPCPVWWEAPGVGSPSNWDPTRDKETYPPGGFMRYFGNQPHNFHLVGAKMSTTVPNNNEDSSPTGTMKTFEMKFAERWPFLILLGVGFTLNWLSGFSV